MKKVLFSFSATAFLMIASIVTVKAQSDIMDVAMGAPDCSKLTEAIKTAGLVDKFKMAGPYTVFAPNNAAFEKMPVDEYGKLMKNKMALNKMLTGFVVGGNWNASLLMTAIKQNNGSVQLPTMGGTKLTATVEEGKVKLTDENGNIAYVVNADITASNGMVHVIDGVVKPVPPAVTKRN